MEKWIRINLYYKEGVKNGKKYKVAHTTDFGYDVSVLFGGGIERNIAWDDVLQCDYIFYDATKAGMKVLPTGYLQLVIGQ